MSCNLFHCFDPYVVFVYYLPMKWVVFVLIFFFFGWQFNLLSIGTELLIKSMVKLIWYSFNPLIKNLIMCFLMLFSMILLVYSMNVGGLIPYVFSASSHLSVNLSFSLSLWLAGVLMSLASSVNFFLSHMVSTGTPMVLWVFLVLVESISQLIRPFTLSIRLMANVMAGHLIMNLIGLMISSTSLFFFLIPIQMIFLFFEFWISLVQAYVFVSLLSLYWDESNH